jgi:hypothetical protein
MKLLLLTLALFSAGRANAAEINRPYAGLGIFHQNIGKVTDDATAAPSYLGETYFPELVFGWRFERFLPTLGWTILGRKTNDGEKRHSVMRLELPYLFPLFSGIQPKAGMGLMLYQIYGEGSTVTLRNGGSTSNFYVPGGSRTSKIFYAALGGGFEHGNLRADVDLLISGLLTTRRAFHLSLRGGYVF